MRLARLLLLPALTACGDPLTRPEPPAPVVVVRPLINVQLGETPVGTQPRYTVTGQLHATLNGSEIPATIDSIRIFYRVNNTAWLTAPTLSTLPFTASLPYAARSGDVFTISASLYASAADPSGRRTRAVGEFSVQRGTVDP